MALLKLFTLVLLLSTGTPVSAKLIQIIHTNDLHSYFNGTRGGGGGYARVKTLADELRTQALKQGIPTLFLDGGDFGEGSSYYFSNQGIDSLRALDFLGVDVSVLGNHDYILGGREFRKQIDAANLKTRILSANVVGKSLMGLKDHLPDSVDFLLGDLKVRVFGLTTPELHFQYPLLPLGFISSPHNAGIKQSKKASKDGVDFVIALTHTGFSSDKKLVKKSSSIDLVVGGHDHLKFTEPRFQENKKGELIPIVQAGAHGLSVGSILMDVASKGEAKLIDYRLYNVSKDIPEDPTVKSFVADASVNREQYFGRAWEEVIGFSEITLNGNYNGVNRNFNSCWSHHMARLTREKAGTDLSLHFDMFQGEEIAPGPITYGDMVDNFPHFRKWGDQGWSVTTANVHGIVLKKILKVLKSSLHIDVTMDGIQRRSPAGKLSKFRPRLNHPDEALVLGRPIRDFKVYSIALPSEIPYGLRKSIGILSTYVLRKQRTVPDSHYWPMLESYIKANSPLRCLED